MFTGNALASVSNKRVRKDIPFEGGLLYNDSTSVEAELGFETQMAFGFI